MKIATYSGMVLMLIMIGLPANLQAQRRTAQAVAVVKVDRPAKRQIRRHERRVHRRTLRKLPAGTRAVVYRNRNYYPVGGMYYVSRKGAYIRTFPPVGFRIRTLAVAPVRVVVRSRPYWYAEGIFYTKEQEEYVVAETTVGAVVPELPEDAGEIDFSGVTAYELNNAVYQEVEDGFEVIELLDEL